MMLSDCSDYIVKFFKGSGVHEMLIVAHNDDEAAKLAEMQCKYSKIGSGKFELISVRKKGEPDPMIAALDKFRY